MLVVDGDDDALAEAIPQLAPAIRLDGKARFLHLAVARPVLAEEADQVVLALPPRREAKSELGHRRPRDAARLELDQGPLPGRALQQGVMQLLGREQVQRG